MEKKDHHIEMIQEGQMNIFEADYQKKEQEALKMVEQAMAKLSAELRVEKVNPYVAAVGNFLMDFLEDNPSSAEKFMAEGKTIIGSMKDVRKEAEKVQVNNCGVLTSEQGFEIVLKYFDITTGDTPDKQVDVPKATNTVNLSGGATPRFEASLDEFL
ncbi:hypothetical protein [Lysinibacillus sphaericus]|uniref:hypothetical protein n=1 Tax=Lysinibacillus sphaericus TaxID=1421 RepID=UPI000564C7AF|nr:hypothetical protein [Lysinibacillus sphaericus]